MTSKDINTFSPHCDEESSASSDWDDVKEEYEQAEELNPQRMECVSVDATSSRRPPIGNRFLFKAGILLK